MIWTLGRNPSPLLYETAIPRRSAELVEATGGDPADVAGQLKGRLASGAA
jgi:hypothetical protein